MMDWTHGWCIARKPGMEGGREKKNKVIKKEKSGEREVGRER